ncbi:MAG: HD domain-containing phosphohydrolase [Candidatus Omnitrophota bacterium]
MQIEIQRELIQKIKSSDLLKRGEDRFGAVFGSVSWWITPRIPSHVHELKKILFAKLTLPISRLIKSPIRIASARKALIKSGKTRHIERFSIHNGPQGFVYPIVMQNTVCGFMGALVTKKNIDERLFALFASFADAVIREAGKGIELEKLYETVRPRAIALSTVHTVHRLLSSTLDLNELLPRIARLTLQILRANRCSIKLVDSKRKVLLPKVTVDLRKKKIRLKKVRIGRWAPGKAVKQARTIRRDNYLSTPLIDEDVVGVITIYDKIDKRPFTSFDEEIMTTLAEQAVIAIKNAQLYKEQERLTLGGIKSLVAVLNAHRPKSYRQPIVSLHKISLMMGHELKMDENELKTLEYASVLHDAGQLVVPEKVLTKPTKLTGEEFELVKEHPMRGVKFIRPMKALRSVIPIILHHHENYDGTGYPKGLKKDQIPLGASVMAVVGSFEAMITRRPYRTPLGIDDAAEEIAKNSGTQFDPEVVAVFLRVMKRREVRSMLRKEIDGS